MHDQAAAAFAENLFAAAKSEVRQYLATRNLTSEQPSISGLAIRSAPASISSRGSRPLHGAQLEASGLFGKREDGTFYDRFRGSLMFPIHNESGKMIAFGGRALKSGDEPKYLNSPETQSTKSYTLYNLHRAKEAVRKGDRTVLVEGIWT